MVWNKHNPAKIMLMVKDWLKVRPLRIGLLGGFSAAIAGGIWFGQQMCSSD